MKTADVLRELSELVDSKALLVFANGRIATESLYLGDAPNHFYMLGSMGQASMIGMGIALAFPKVTCIVVDGDGNLLMNPAAVITIGKCRPANLVHIVIDNGVYQTTGGQPTMGDVWDMCSFARDCGYCWVENMTKLGEISGLFDEMRDRRGPGFLRIEVRPGILAEAPPFDKSPESIRRDVQNFLKECSDVPRI